MIEIINSWGAAWLRLFFIFELQNTLFILLLLAIVIPLKKISANFRKQLTVLGLIKTLIPPLIPMFLISSPATFVRIQQTIDTKTFLNLTMDASPFSSITHINLFGMLFLVWLFGMMIIALHILHRFMKLHGLTREATKLEIGNLKLPAHTSLFLHPDVKSPMVFGLFFPKIILPANWSNLPKRMQNSLLMHEINHIRNGDLYLNVLKILTFLIHFFNPIQWVLLHYFQLFTEMSCDDSTIKAIKLRRSEYSTFILKSAEAITIPPGFVFRGLEFSHTFELLKQRINYQLNQKEESKMKLPGFLRLSIFLFLIFILLPLSFRCSMDQKNDKVTNLTTPQSETNSVDENGAYALFAVDKMPELLNKVRPIYPEKARRAGIQGLVVLTVTIDKTGKVIKAVPLTKELPVIDSNGKVIGKRPAKRIPELEPAAIAAALKCTFKPAEKDGHPVRVKMNVPFRFRLKN